MFNTIMVPVDLRHPSGQDKALTIAATLAKADGASVTHVGVTGPEPGDLGHAPAEYDARLQRFASAQAELHGLDSRGQTIVANGPAVDLDRKLAKTVDEIGAVLVVMASHISNLRDYVWPSHRGRLARHAKASVFLVRG